MERTRSPQTGRLVAGAVAVAAAASLHAQNGSFWTFLEPGRRLERCAESSSAHRRATASLTRLGQQIERLKDADPPDRSLEELRGMLRTECFLPAAETERIPKPDSSVSLKQWWIDGGAVWLESFLELPRQGPIENPTPHVVVPPDARKTLALDAHGDHPLQSLLCAIGDGSCGAATRGWKLRADAHFEAHRTLGRSAGSVLSDERPASGADVTSRECAVKAASSQIEQRYQVWRACIEDKRAKTVALPLGEFKAPSGGWIVISGRRGHYDFCDTTRTYNLGTGAAFVYESCSALVLQRDGSVDFDATNKARMERVSAGTVQVQNLREAVWMMLFRAEAEEVQLKSEYYPLPAGLTPRMTVRQEQRTSVGPAMWASTSQSSLTWRWAPATGSTFVGELTWPFSYDAAEDHAASLLNVAEAGFVEECQRVPAAPMFPSGPALNLNDVPARSVERLDRDFRNALTKWKALPACR